MKKGIITKHILITIFLLIGVNSFSQTLKIESFKQKGNNLFFFEFKVKNNTNSPLGFYKPNLRDLCNGILSINFKSDDNRVNSPDCDFEEHINAIYLSCNNTIVLNKNESFSFFYEIKKPKYLKDLKEIILTINYKNVNFVNRENTCKAEVFQEILSANWVVGNGTD